MPCNGRCVLKMSYLTSFSRFSSRFSRFRERIRRCIAPVRPF